MEGTSNIPLFPLNTVLFPGGVLPLRIFEARYLDMVSECLRDGAGFGVCAIRSGAEVGKAADCYLVGTFAQIQDFDRTDDGLLYILARGEQRFRILTKSVEGNGLLRAEVEWLDDGPETALPADRRPLAEFLAQLLKQAGKPFAELAGRYDSAAWVAGRLTELLPFAIEDKQRLLEMDHPLDRLESLYRELLAEEVSRR
jgi:Lon protease-like protein